MNLFVTSKDPAESARNLDDKRLGKALIECNQMMSYAIREHHGHLTNEHFGEGRLSQGAAGMNNGISKWVRANAQTFDWTLKHTWALVEEWQFRFGTEHISAQRTPFIADLADCLPLGQMLPFFNGARHKDLGLDFTYLPPPASYRHYLNARWSRDTLPVVFTRRGEPEWARFRT